MPLAFHSKSHGQIAFGFFNIESDMLLLEDLFFFAHDFCTAAVRLAGEGSEPAEHAVRGWRIDDWEKMGNLHGAIAGVDLSGFIGATYRAWPFPQAPENFKQNPRGFDTRDEVRRTIAPFGHEEEILFTHDSEGSAFSIAEYAFDRRGFEKLMAYVDRGGHPRWKGEERPDYVLAMTEQVVKAGWKIRA